MLPSRIQLTVPEQTYYATLFSKAGPDLMGYIPGKVGAQFLSSSNLTRDVLHKIWALADVQQIGKLDRENFNVACRLVAHAQCGSIPDHSVVDLVPRALPIFAGLAKQSLSGAALNRDVDTISISDTGNEGNGEFIDTSKARTIALSLSKLGLSPLEFIPFQSGPDASPSSNWCITEVNRQKYMGLFAKLTTTAAGVIDGKTSRAVLEKSGLNQKVLGLIWELADMNGDGCLDAREFLIAMHLTTKCKKGAALPAELPEELLTQLKDLSLAKTPVSLSPPESSFRRDRSIPAWNFSRTYLTGPGSAVETEKRLRIDLQGDMDESEEEMRHLFDMCAQVETDISRMRIELDKRDSLLTELDRTRKESMERKGAVTETRRQVNFDKISLNRDKANLQSEILHLRKLVADSNCDVEALRGSVNETGAELERVEVQIRTLDTQRREAVHQHGEELIKIEAEQRETAELVDSWNRLGREQEIRLESQRIHHERERIVSEMQRDPTVDFRTVSVSQIGVNKWSPTLLKNDNKHATGNIGFGTTFFK